MQYEFRRGLQDAPTEATWALGRKTDRTYLHRTFTFQIPTSRDYGKPARYIVKVFDELADRLSPTDSDRDLEWRQEILHTTPAGRKQLKIQIAGTAGEVRQIEIQRVTTSGGDARLENVLTLDREAAGRLIDVIQALPYIPVEGDEDTVRLDDQTLRDIFRDPDIIGRLYASAPEAFREAIRADASASDVVALAHRKAAVDRFRRLLSDEDAFEEARSELGGRRESVWQQFLENNPWILGVGLAGQLLTSWSDSRLEQVVSGFSIAGPGKRTDALLRTTGRIRSMVFAEIKHHQTSLLGGTEYRPGCWPPSTELAGGVTQIQQTVDRAVDDIRKRLPDRDEEGVETGEATWLIRPRSFLVLGHLDQLRGSAGVHPTKYQSFELYRRNLYEPEIMTFDELLARAEWHVQLAELEA